MKYCGDTNCTLQLTVNRIYIIINKIGLEMVKLYSDGKRGLEMVRFNNEYGFILNSVTAVERKWSCNEWICLYNNNARKVYDI